MKLKKNIKIAGLLLAILIPLYLVEVLLAGMQKRLVVEHMRLFSINEPRPVAADRLKVKLSVNSRWFRELKIRPPEGFFIGTWPNERVIGFKEGDGDEWPIHTTDRYGYFNQNEYWNDPKLLLIGDSFVTCEHLQEFNLTTHLREKHCVKAVNIGLTGSGPILQLAALKESWWRISNSVDRIVWLLYDGNDFQDAVEENQVAEYWNAALSDGYVGRVGSFDLLSSFNDSNLYDWKYAVRSVLKLTRTRRVASQILSSDDGPEIWSKCIKLAEQHTGKKVTLIRIGKPTARPLDAQWNDVECGSKIELNAPSDHYSKSFILAHLNRNGYKMLAKTILSEHD